MTPSAGPEILDQAIISYCILLQCIVGDYFLLERWPCVRMGSFSVFSVNIWHSPSLTYLLLTYTLFFQLKAKHQAKREAYLKDWKTIKTMSKVFDSSPTSQTVSITGLKSRAELNGEKGVVLEHLSNERLKVRLNGSAIVISVKPENVILVDIEETVEARVIIHSRAINTNLRVWPNKTFFYPCKCTTESR